MELLQCIPTNALSDFLNVYISVSPFGNGLVSLSAPFRITELRMAAFFVDELEKEITRAGMARVSQWRIPHVEPSLLARIVTGISGVGGANIRMYSRASKF
jgi:hypothetical protein